MDTRAVTALGYTVERVQAGVFRVDGYGLSTYLREDDAAAWAALADTVAHAERVDQFVNGPPARPEPPPPIEQKVAAELDKLDPEKATVADVLAAVKQVLA